MYGSVDDHDNVHEAKPRAEAEILMEVDAPYNCKRIEDGETVHEAEAKRLVVAPQGVCQERNDDVLSKFEPETASGAQQYAVDEHDGSRHDDEHPAERDCRYESATNVHRSVGLMSSA